MRSIPLRLETYYIDETRAKALPNYQAPEVPDIFDAVNCLPTVDEHPETPNRFRVRVDISVTPTSGALAPYEAFVRILGFFRITDPGAPEDAKRQLIHGAAVSMLYSAARDHLYTVTAKGPNEPLILPAVTIPVPGDRTAQFWGADIDAE
jgi:preprotein translocase subunit SecB